ncbi:hypothetical protein P154DRAFT_431661 [Amniculicola lignicola CBS 123094]|uniref:Xylanolytic transcriptional activator regulatory domain-containing protein n=1 Tax=Amniculicola lignicola CBS 123094 TaxID=1392246 RepID=A0A6A5WMV7_9PLEO|nr:hypothetical protein P154DRAFT_431661 [Amniculicola lignicola CBS 123094]
MFTFISTTSEHPPQKRKQTQRACESCRRRKKRCKHSNQGGGTSPPIAGSMGSSIAGPSQGQTASNSAISMATLTDVYLPSPTGSDVGPPISNPTPSMRGASLADAEDRSRFVGDLNPEGIFLTAARPDTRETAPSFNGVGIWHSRRAANAIAESYQHNSAGGGSSNAFHRSAPIMSNFMLPLLEEQCMNFLPQPSSVEFLTNIYLVDIHAMFPVLDVKGFLQLDAKTPAKILLTQAICLAASTNCKGLSHLTLLGSPTSGSSRKEFVQQLSTAIQTSIHIGLVRDRLILTQVLSIVSMFTQFSDDRHSSAELCGRAVSYIHTMGIHLAEGCEPRQDSEYLTTLFCAVWALDRVNAAFHGRPTLMHERDLGRDLEEAVQRQESCFQLFLRIVMLLDEVIDLYRPHVASSEQSWESKFPSFEDLAKDAVRVKTQRLATMEVFYHAIGMLSCRKPAIQEQLQSSPSYTRQSLSATRITAIFAEESRDELIILPIVPYAISLSLRVAYRELRFTKIPMLRTRARKQLLANCAILREFGDIFWSTTYLADLAEETVRELDKVCFTIAQSQYDTGGTVPGQPSTALPPSPGARLIETSSSNEKGSSAANLNGNMHSSSGTQSTGTCREDLAPVPFDALDFEGLPDLDLFQHFDPDFDLKGIDAALFNLDDLLLG